MDHGLFGHSQREAFDAICAWHGGDRAGACVVYGPAGAGKATVIDRFFGSLDGSGAQRVLVRAGARAFAPLDLGDAAALLGVDETELAAALDAHRAVIDPVIAWGERWSALRFRHEALRAAWVAASEDGAALCERRFVEAARALLGACARASGRPPEGRAAAYLRR
ncbi:hypothetical protein [Sorangium sp. So ce406]|uniref:hypothetical protein n=1 Tax=Sorangium sp. So ce406 TaxID=3133311 RepID=UPI003F5B38C9